MTSMAKLHDVPNFPPEPPQWPQWQRWWGPKIVNFCRTEGCRTKIWCRISYVSRRRARSPNFDQSEAEKLSHTDTYTHTHTKSTYCQALLSEQRLQKLFLLLIELYFLWHNCLYFIVFFLLFSNTRIEPCVLESLYVCLSATFILERLLAHSILFHKTPLIFDIKYFWFLFFIISFSQILGGQYRILHYFPQSYILESITLVSWSCILVCQGRKCLLGKYEPNNI